MSLRGARPLRSIGVRPRKVVRAGRLLRWFSSRAAIRARSSNTGMSVGLVAPEGLLGSRGPCEGLNKMGEDNSKPKPLLGKDIVLGREV